MGIGADGLILMNHSSDVAFGMSYFNSDGYESTMCGNGGRCLTAFARRLGIPGTAFIFDAADGIHHSVITGETGSIMQVRLKMRDVEIPLHITPDHVINAGSPHLVRVVKGIRTLDVCKLGREIRNSGPHKTNGVNVNFIEIEGNTAQIRTYERGVEDETLSCGTGAVAAALVIATQRSSVQSPVILHAPGGMLTVHFKRTKNLFHDIWLEGPATFVFQGEFTI